MRKETIASQPIAAMSDAASVANVGTYNVVALKLQFSVIKPKDTKTFECFNSKFCSLAMSN